MPPSRSLSCVMPFLIAYTTAISFSLPLFSLVRRSTWDYGIRYHVFYIFSSPFMFIFCYIAVMLIFSLLVSLTSWETAYKIIMDWPEMLTLLPYSFHHNFL